MSVGGESSGEGIRKVTSIRTALLVEFLEILIIELQIYRHCVLLAWNELRWIDTKAGEDQRRQVSFQCFALTWKTP